MELRNLRTALAVSLLFGTAIAGAATTMEATAHPEMWFGYNDTKGRKAPTLLAVPGPDDSKGVEITACDDGAWQGIMCIFGAPVKLEPGDVLKFYARQTADKNKRNLMLNAVFAAGQLHFGTTSISSEWTAVTVPLDPAKWVPSEKKDRPAEFGALVQIAIYPSSSLDTVGETLGIAGLQILKADGTPREIQLADSLIPTAEEAQWMDLANWSGALGNKEASNPPKVEVMETPKGKAVVARPVEKGMYQGITVKFPAPVDLDKSKALVFDLYSKVGRGGNAYIWMYCAGGNVLHTSIPSKEGDWLPIRVELDGSKLKSVRKVEALGMLESFRVTRYGDLDNPGEELAIRNIHFIPKD